MKLRPFLPLACLLIGLVGPLAPQQPDTLRHSIPAPFGTAQEAAQLGSSVAVEGAIPWAGRPVMTSAGRTPG